MKLFSQSFHRGGRRCLPTVFRDCAPHGTRFPRIKADFAGVYPRSLCEKALAVPLRAAESPVMALKHRVVTVTLPKAKKPTTDMLEHSGRLEHQLLHHRLDATALGAVAHRRVGRVHHSNLLHRRSARVPLDDEGNISLEAAGLGRDLLHQLQRRKTRIGAHQKSFQYETCGHRQGALKLVLALGGRMLHARPQGQFQAITQAAQVHGKGAVAIDSCVGAANQLFLGASVVHGKGIEINRGVATLQRTKVNWLAVDAAAEQQLVHLGCKVKPDRGVGIQTLTQGRTRGNTAKPQSALEEIIAPKVLASIKIILAQTQQAQVAFEDVAMVPPERTGKVESTKELSLIRLRYFPMNASPAWALRP